MKPFNFEQFLTENGWVLKNDIFYKSNKSIRLIQNGKMMCALNLNPNIKHKHIVTCEIPQSKTETENLFRLTFL